MKYNFPEINKKESKLLRHYTNHLKSEIREYEEAEDLKNEAEEVIDILHAAETLVRKYFKANPRLDPDKLIQEVIQKNRRRGYYI